MPFFALTAGIRPIEPRRCSPNKSVPLSRTERSGGPRGRWTVLPGTGGPGDRNRRISAHSSLPWTWLAGSRARARAKNPICRAPAAATQPRAPFNQPHTSRHQRTGPRIPLATTVQPFTPADDDLKLAPAAKARKPAKARAEPVKQAPPVLFRQRSRPNLTGLHERLPISPRSQQQFPASAATIGPFTPRVS